MSEWYAVRTATRQERKALAGLTEHGVTVFLPMQARWGVEGWAKTKARVESPLLPGYLFALIGEDQIRQVLEIDGVHAIVGCYGEDGYSKPMPIPLAAILEFQIGERSGAYDSTRTIKVPYRPKKGDVVKITHGPWQSFMAKVLSTPKGQRAHLMIEGPYGGGKTLDVAHLTAA